MGGRPLSVGFRFFDDRGHGQATEKLYSMVTTPDEIVETCAPLVTKVKADIVTIQIASLDQEATIFMLGSEVLPRLREL